MTWGDKARELPDEPGVYLMRNPAGEVIYVGKANSLRQRVRSYCHGPEGQPPKVQALIRNVADLEHIVTDSPMEALVLECSLIKSYRPHYNINLKDDKAYPYLKIDLGQEFPRMGITRRRKDDKARYFGPYTDAGALKYTFRLVRRIFPLRTCLADHWSQGHRPCLNAHLGLCLAPCSGRLDPEAYLATVENLVAFLEGRGSHLVRSLRQRMEEAAGALRFEEAARLRDQWQAVEKVLNHRKVAFSGKGDQDVLGLACSAAEACVQVFLMRKSTVAAWQRFFLETGGSPPGEILSAFLQQYYSDQQEIPGVILLPEPVEDEELLVGWLSSKRGRKVQLVRPRRGKRAELVARATANASSSLQLSRMSEERRAERVAALKEALGLERLPRRIEGYDISHLQGEAAVGSMVVFLEGRPLKQQYRRFRIKEAGRADDYASLEEVLRRRLGRTLAGDPKFACLPDLILIDGGRGQVHASRKVATELGFGGIPLFGLAKEEEVVFPSEGGPELRLGRDTPALQLLQEVRDEAHRFALSFHHRLRGSEAFHSVLDTIPGVGPKRRQALIVAFGSLEGLREASVEEIAAIKGIDRRTAARVKDSLGRG